MKSRARRKDQKPGTAAPTSRIEHADLTEEDEQLALEIWLEIGRQERLASAGQSLADTEALGGAAAAPAAAGSPRA